MGRSVPLAVIVFALVTAAGSTPRAVGASAPPKESVVFFYQQIDSSDQSKFVGARGVVAGDQANDATAITTIHAAGALAIKYTNVYWYPADRPYEGIDIGAHKSWAFCKTGQTPYAGRSRNNVQWFYIDANERAARTAIDAYFDHLKSIGYDGVFFDRGSAALRANKHAITWKASTCTGTPVHTKHRRFADVYASVIHDASQRGLTVYLNYANPYGGSPLRPDPTDKDCRVNDWPHCKTRRDLWASVSEIVDENQGGTRAAKQFSYDLKTGAASEAHLPASGVPKVIREIRVNSANRQAVFFRWARARLHRILTFVDTGDDGCGGKSGCNHFGTYPELTAIAFGKPVDTAPRSSRCNGPKVVQCLWVRRYRNGMVAVNPTDHAKLIRRLKLKLAACRFVEDVYRSPPGITPVAMNNDRCITRVSYRIPAHSGRVLLYATSAW